MNTVFPRLRAAALPLVGSILLAACAGTPLEEAPVVDARATAAQPAAPADAAANRNGVAQVTANAPMQAMPGPAGAPRVIYFAYESALIGAEFRPVLERHAAYLRRHEDRKLTVGGHTDERGGREYNLALGQQRADAVRSALGLLGVPAAQVEAVSFGEEKPASAGHDEAEWGLNRRAELAYR